MGWKVFFDEFIGIDCMKKFFVVICGIECWEWFGVWWLDFIGFRFGK